MRSGRSSCCSRSARPISTSTSGTTRSNYFREVERQHPYSEWSRRAILMTAYAHYEANDYAEAIADADQLHRPLSRQRRHPLRLLSEGHLLLRADRRRRAATRPPPSRPQVTLREVIKRYPNTEYAADARLKIDMVMDQLAGKEMTIGRYYLRNGDPIAAIGRFRTVVDKYQTTSHTPEALYRLVEAYLTVGLVDEASKNGAVLGYNYPGDIWYHDAYKLLTVPRPAADGDADRQRREPAASRSRHRDNRRPSRRRRRIRPPTPAVAQADAAKPDATLDWRDPYRRGPAGYDPDRLDLRPRPSRRRSSGLVHGVAGPLSAGGFSVILAAMLIGLGHPRRRADREPGPGLRAGPDRAHRRDRRRQVDHPGRAGPGHRRAGRRRPSSAAAPARPRPPPSSRRAPDHAGLVLSGGEGPGLRAGRGPGAAPHARRPTAARAPSSTTSRPASPCCASWARCWSRCTASTRRSACSTRATHRPLLDAFGGCERAVQRLRRRPGASGARRASRRQALSDRRRPLAEEAEELAARLAELDRLDPARGRGGEAWPRNARCWARPRRPWPTSPPPATRLGDGGARPAARPGLPGAGAGAGRALATGAGAEGSADRAPDRRGDRGGGPRPVRGRRGRRPPSTRPREAFDFEPDRLEKAEERLFALRAVARKLGVAVDDLPAARAEHRRAPAGACENGEEALRRPRRRAAAARAAYLAAAAGAHRRAPRRRRPAGRRRRGRARAAEARQGPLPRRRRAAGGGPRRPRRRRPGGVRDRHHSRRAVRRPGRHRLGRRAGPLRPGAEGRRWPAAAGAQPLMIFDEVDQGVGGAVADAVGQRLKRLAARRPGAGGHPQPAGRRPGRRPLAGAPRPARAIGSAPPSRSSAPAAREEEIARMLSGAEITDAARAAARALMHA